MASKQTKINASSFIAIKYSRCWIASVLLLGAWCLPGCQQLPGGQAMRQYQLESERLVSEFRAQKKRAEELEARNVQLEQRLAESEKLLARTQNGSGRRSSRGGGEILLGEARDARTLENLSESGSSRSSIANGYSSRPSAGLPDAESRTSGRFASGSNRDPIALGGASRDLRGDRERDPQWRPISSPSK